MNTASFKTNSPFWGTDFKILLNKDQITEVFPTPKMSYNQKLNSITRLIILLSVLGFILTTSFRFLLIGFITLVIIYFISYKRDNHTTYTPNSSVEAFSGEHFNKPIGKQLLNPQTLEPFLKDNFERTTPNNPLANVLLTDIYDNPDRKSASPSFNTDVYDDITNATKKMIQDLNPGIKNTNKQLFGDLFQKFSLDQSLRQWYSTPNTKIASDQGAYGTYLYGTMPSSKGGNGDALAALQREKDSYRYTLY